MKKPAPLPKGRGAPPRGHNSGGKLTLPAPPSTNSLFRNVPGKGRVKTIRYLTWIRAAQNQAMAQPRFHVAGSYGMEVIVRRRNSRLDLDNCLKAIGDFLVTCGYVDDDRHLSAIVARWGEDVDGCLVRVWSIQAEAA